MSIEWDGIVRTKVLHEGRNRIRQELAAAARNFDWPRTAAILRQDPSLVNTTRPDGRSLFAPLHQAAHGGAPTNVAGELLKLGAWRTLQNARGERALDVAERQGHRHLLSILEPQLKRRVPTGVLLKIQTHFHNIILGRAADQVRRHSLRLPELEPLLELDQQDFWFPVPGMCGGFSYHLRSEGVKAVLVSASWCRVVDGSGQRHEVTSSGSRLVEEGFV